MEGLAMEGKEAEQRYPIIRWAIVRVGQFLTFAVAKCLPFPESWFSFRGRRAKRKGKTLTLINLFRLS